MMDNRRPPVQTLSTERLHLEILRLDAAMKDAHPAITLNYREAELALAAARTEMVRRTMEKFDV
jgi:hypothetical protein